VPLCPTMMKKLRHHSARLRNALRLSVRKFVEIDGGEYTSAFAFNAFLALFPLVILLVAAASTFADRGTASAIIIGLLQKQMPLSGEMRDYIFSTISDVINARGSASMVALFMLVWAATQFFRTLVLAANRAWGITGERWWRLSLKNLTLLGVMVLAVLIGMGLPVLAKIAGEKAHIAASIPAWAERFWTYFAPWILVFLSLAIFYRLAPRRRTKLYEVWFPALAATALLYWAQALFVIYLRSYATLNAVYGAFGGIIALMLWIYISGAILIFCACLCAVQADARQKPPA